MKNLSKTTKTILFASLIAAMILPFSGMNFAEAEKVDDKSSVKTKLKDKMTKLLDKDKKEKQTNKKHTSEEYGVPYSLFFEDNGKLVVGINADKAEEFNKKYSKDDVKGDLNTTVDLDVRYFEFVRESNVRGGDNVGDSGGSSTITVVKNNKIILTGHGFAENDIVHAGLVGGTTCLEIEVTEDDNSSGDYADAAYGVDTYNSSCNNTYINDSIHYNGNNYAVTYGTASDIVYEKAIIIAGITTTSSGYILDTDVTIRDNIGILNDQVIGSYTSGPGDSGAPIFETTGSSSAKLLGQHVGRACEVDLNSGTTYSYWCDSFGQGGLKYFTPWDQVATHLGI